mmetsp:Transcript_14743/g.29865  ORF Transcript_14743/g.29865 Transcript_14743/m.29865 type:complete len:304 (+) Transcript_14743:600-1511(+)
MEWIVKNLSKRGGWGDVVSEAADRNRLTTASTILLLPFSEKFNENVLRVSLVEQLREEVKVGHQSSLEDDRDVGGVEEFDRVRSGVSTVTFVFDREIDTETLEVDHDNENEYSGKEVEDVGKILAVERFIKSAHLICTGDEHVEHGNDGSLELSSTASVDGCWGERLPDDVLADIRCNKERNPRSKTVTLSEELVEHKNNHTSEEKLEDNEGGISGTKLFDVTVHTRHNVCNSFTDGNEEAAKLLRTLEQGAVFLLALVYLDNLRTSQQLHHHTRRHNWRDTQFHQGTPVGRKNDAHPVERIS